MNGTFILGDLREGGLLTSCLDFCWLGRQSCCASSPIKKSANKEVYIETINF